MATPVTYFIEALRIFFAFWSLATGWNGKRSSAFVVSSTASTSSSRRREALVRASSASPRRFWSFHESRTSRSARRIDDS